MLTIFLRSVILYAASLLAMRAMGKRQVGQLQPFELVVVIMIAELAATPMGGVGIPILYGLLPMAALVVCHGLLTALCMKSRARAGVALRAADGAGAQRRDLREADAGVRGGFERLDGSHTRRRHP